MKVMVSSKLQELPDEYAGRLFEQGAASLPKEMPVTSSRPKRTKDVSNNEPKGQDRKKKKKNLSEDGPLRRNTYVERNTIFVRNRRRSCPKTKE